MASIKESVKEYYGKILKTKEDLKTNACCTGDETPDSHKSILKQIEPEIMEKFYGYGCPIPPSLDNQTVLDLMSGSGQDVYLASKGTRQNILGLLIVEIRPNMIKNPQVEYVAKRP